MKLESIELTTRIPVPRVQNLLCCALEGGSNYWYCNASVDLGGKTRDEVVKLGSHADEDGSVTFEWIGYCAPFVPGCALTMEDKEPEEDDQRPYRVDLNAIRKGLQLMSSGKYAQHWADFLSENEDATTGDVFLQLCIFGEVRYS